MTYLNPIIAALLGAIPFQKLPRKPKQSEAEKQKYLAKAEAKRERRREKRRRGL